MRRSRGGAAADHDPLSDVLERRRMPHARTPRAALHAALNSRPHTAAVPVGHVHDMAHEAARFEQSLEQWDMRRQNALDVYIHGEAQLTTTEALSPLSVPTSPRARKFAALINFSSHQRSPLVSQQAIASPVHRMRTPFAAPPPPVSVPSPDATDPFNASTMPKSAPAMFGHPSFAPSPLHLAEVLSTASPDQTRSAILTYTREAHRHAGPAVGRTDARTSEDEESPAHRQRTTDARARATLARAQFDAFNAGLAGSPLPFSPFPPPPVHLPTSPDQRSNAITMPRPPSTPSPRPGTGPRSLTRRRASNDASLHGAAPMAVSPPLRAVNQHNEDPEAAMEAAAVVAAAVAEAALATPQQPTPAPTSTATATPAAGAAHAMATDIGGTAPGPAPTTSHSAGPDTAKAPTPPVASPALAPDTPLTIVAAPASEEDVGEKNEESDAAPSRRRRTTRESFIRGKDTSAGEQGKRYSAELGAFIPAGPGSGSESADASDSESDASEVSDIDLVDSDLSHHIHLSRTLARLANRRASVDVPSPDGSPTSSAPLSVMATMAQREKARNRKLEEVRQAAFSTPGSMAFEVEKRREEARKRLMDNVQGAVALLRASVQPSNGLNSQSSPLTQREAAIRIGRAWRSRNRAP